MVEIQKLFVPMAFWGIWVMQKLKQEVLSHKGEWAAPKFLPLKTDIVGSNESQERAHKFLFDKDKEMEQGLLHMGKA